mmetsp:Transcript_28385/g.42102  ORF Transcript_28385/g.42102 Transcript_28385/m.42102 type:complete len:136 (+) Transcript_28385:84-491(+)
MLTKGTPSFSDQKELLSKHTQIISNMTANFYQNKQTYQQDVPCVEFSAMGFETHESQQSFSTASTASVSSSAALSRSSHLSGWGSAISRKSYACLKTLGENEARKMHRPPSRIPRKVATQETADSWGYFVDTPDN